MEHCRVMQPEPRREDGVLNLNVFSACVHASCALIPLFVPRFFDVAWPGPKLCPARPHYH